MSDLKITWCNKGDCKDDIIDPIDPVDPNISIIEDVNGNDLNGWSSDCKILTSKCG